MDMFWFFTPLSLFDDWQINKLLKTGLGGGEGCWGCVDWLPLHIVYLARQSEAAFNKRIIIRINNNSPKIKRENCWHQLLNISSNYVRQTKCPCVFIPHCYSCVFVFLCRRLRRRQCFAASAFSVCCHCSPRKLLLSYLLSCLEDFSFFLFFLKTRACSSASLAVSLISSFRLNVELLLCTSGYEVALLCSYTGDRGLLQKHNVTRNWAIVLENVTSNQSNVWCGGI